MAEKTTSDQLEELNKEINQKYAQLHALPIPTGTEESRASLDERDAYVKCVRELDVLIRTAAKLYKRSRSQP